MSGIALCLDAPHCPAFLGHFIVVRGAWGGAYGLGSPTFPCFPPAGQHRFRQTDTHTHTPPTNTANPWRCEPLRHLCAPQRAPMAVACSLPTFASGCIASHLAAGDVTVAGLRLQCCTGLARFRGCPAVAGRPLPTAQARTRPPRGAPERPWDGPSSAGAVGSLAPGQAPAGSSGLSRCQAQLRPHPEVKVVGCVPAHFPTQTVAFPTQASAFIPSRSPVFFLPTA